MRLSLPRIFAQLFNDRPNIYFLVIMDLLTHGSLYKAELYVLLKRHGFKDTDISKAIQDLTLHKMIKGAHDARAEMEVAIQNMADESNAEQAKPAKKREIKQKIKE